MERVEDMKAVHFIITAGGTREPIDDVRFIGNRSTGKLGAAIADEAHTRGHRVSLIRAVDAIRPLNAGKINEVTFEQSASLREHLRKQVTAAQAPTVVVHAAAVADYLPEKTSGKIPSGAETLTLRLVRAEKIVDSIKDWNPAVLLVKFKLESGCTREELLHAGRTAGRVSGADWIVANDIREISGTCHPALIIDQAGNWVAARTKDELAGKLIQQITETLIPGGGRNSR